MLLTAMATFPKSSGVFRESMQRWVTDKLWIKSMMSKELGIPSSKLLFADHHMSHAASSFFTSPYEEAAILTVDGAGEWSTATMGVGCGNKIEVLKELRFPHSLGLLYSAFTAYCGFEINEGEYKLMGMHPYGEPKYVDKIYELIEVGEDGSLWHDMKYFTYHFSRDTTLAEAFVSELSEQHRTMVKGFSPEVLRVLQAQPWPGNVRELRNVIENMVVTGTHEILELSDLPPGLATTEVPAPGPELSGSSLAGRTAKEVEKEHIRATLEMVGGHRKQAAQLMGIGERTLFRKIKEYGLA